MRAHKTSFTFWSVIGLILMTTIGGLVWRFTPLHNHLSMQDLMEQGRALQTHACAPFVMMGVYMAGGLILFFHAVLLWTTIFIFDGWHAFLYCELGTMASALTMYGLGRVVRPEVVERIAGSYLDKVSKALAKKGKLTLMVLHWFPICPFSILNFISGATHINLEDFIVGTFVGCTPGLLILVFFGRQMIHAAQSHHAVQIIPWLGAVVGLLVLGHYVRKNLKRLKKGAA
jgi:phospholipase D1/2